MSMGIVLHAAWILIPGEAGAPATDASAHRFFEWLCDAIHMFRMQLFFVLAGFFACLLLQKRGFWKFAMNRVARIALPLILFWLILVPIMMWQFHAAGLRSGAIQSNSSAWELTVEYFANISPDGTMFAHLWFLYYLALTYVLVVSAYAVIRGFDRIGKLRQKITNGFGALATRPWSVLLLAGVYAPCLWIMKGGWGIEVSYTTVYPAWPGLISYLLYFLGGWLLFRNVDKLEFIVRGWRWQLSAGLLMTVPYFFYVDAANQDGYSTWKYPNLVIQDIRFDKEADRYDYSAFRTALMTAEESSIAGVVWRSLPELNREFVASHQTATQNQLFGLLQSINLTVLRDPEFRAQFDFTSMPLTEETKRILLIDPEDRTSGQTARLNRRLLEIGFAGVIHAEDVHRPYYYPIRTIR